MFKLESYITPLLLSYVDKYIKNLKPEDSQFSLWGGDAVFSNLDLRLDVLEQELQLPFTFINGHIHELRIHIPWTKLGSEPVIITINTIECILKLCTDKTSSNANQEKKAAGNKSLKKHDITEAPPGYVQSLINRVVSNICIICNNIILKYVEDDIVLSLNIKSVELFNANEKWDKAFVDTNIADTVSRKVIYMQDLTVCLDKRDGCGKIETYQDPLLYRCSSTWRMYSVYDFPHSKYPSLTRIHMYCENLDFSLTDQQLPMFLRLLYLCMALHNKSKLTDEESVSKPVDQVDLKPGNYDEEIGFTENKSHDDSWGSWAWSYLPDVSPLWTYPGSEEEQEKESNLLKSKKIFQFGMYIGKSSCILKHTILPQDPSYCSPSKYSFSPLMIIKMYGCCTELTLKGKDFVNVQNGICGITVTGLENCICGYQDFSGDELKNVFLKSGVPPGSGHSYSFLSSSLFDPLAPENCNLERKYCFNAAEHVATFTEEVMVQRFPAFAFDYLYELEVPEEFIDRISSITSTFLEGSNWHETSMYRIVFGPLCLDVTSSLIHRLKQLMTAAQDYDYPYYAQSRKATVHQIEVSEDMIEEMEEFVPVRQYHATFFKPVFRLSFADHSPNLMPKADSKRVKKRLKSSKYTRSKLFEPNFCFEIFAECLDFHSSCPMYANKLLKVVESVPNPSQFIISQCYESKSMKVFGLEVTLHCENKNMFPESSIMQQTCLAFFSKSLIFPEDWTSLSDLTLKESSLECSSLQFKISEISLLAIIGIHQSWVSKRFNGNGLENLKTAFNESKKGSPLIFFEVKDVVSLYTKGENMTSCKFSISKLCVKFLSDDQSSILFSAPESTNLTYTGIISEIYDCNNSSIKVNHPFLQLLLQIPELNENKDPALLILRVSGSTACLEPAMFEWMSSALFPHLNLKKSGLDLPSSGSADIEDTSTCSSVTQEASASQSLSKSYTSAVAKEMDKSLPQRLECFLLEYAQVLSLLIIEVDVGSLCGIMPQKNWSINHKEGFSILKSWQEADSNSSLKGACVICLPSFKMLNNSSVSDFLDTLDVENVSLPYKMPNAEKRGQDYFPWTLQITSCSIYTVEENMNSRYSYLLCPSTVSATIALSSKGHQNQLALCVHMDSKCVNINLSAFQADLFVNCFEKVSVSTKFMQRLNLWISYFHLESFDAPEYDISASEVFADEYVEVKKGCDANSQSKKTSTSDAKLLTEERKTNRLTLWTQLTLSKLCIVLNGKLPGITLYENFKVQLDGEEIVSSLDIQDVYTKVKVKLTSLNITCFTKRSPEYDWQPGPYEGKVLFCNNMISNSVKPKPLTQHSQTKPDNQPFMVATFTRALHSNVKEKLSFHAKQKAKLPTNDLKYISEIDLKLKSFGIILWMSFCDVLKQLFYPFLKTSVLTCKQNNSTNENIALVGSNFCSENLPLIYIETNAIQIYCPDNKILTNITDKGNSVQKDEDVLLLQLDSITLTSQVENPLPRIVLDSDIYSTAVNSKMVGVPGSAIEDRQYQLDLNGFMFGTICGSNISHRSDLKRDVISHFPLTMGENPALEWNIGVIPENRTLSNDSVTITPILSPFNIRIAVAPAIVIQPNDEFDSKKVVISGISSEVSITNEVFVYLSIHQMCFVYSLVKSNLELLFNTFNHSLNTDPTSSQLPSICTAFRLNSESSSLSDGEKKYLYDFVPFELLITAENVAVMLFYEEIQSDGLTRDCFENHSEKLSSETCDEKVKCFETMNSISNLDGTRKYKYKKSTFKNLHPFLCLSIVQPHSYVLCHPSSQKFESSCFDLLLNGSPVNYTVEKPREVCTPITEDFTLHFLETKSGELNEKTGIPPAFFTVTCSDIFSKPANVKISVERPMKINLRSEICDSSIAFLQHFEQEFSMFTDKPNNLTTSEPENSTFRNEILPYFKNIVLETTQIVLEISPTSKSNSEKIVFSVSNLSLKAEVDGSLGDVKCVNLEMDTSSFVFQIDSNNLIWNFVQPLTFSSLIKFHLIPCLQFELNFCGESLILNLSLNHVLKLKHLIEEVIKLIEKNFFCLDEETKTFNKNSNATNIITDVPKRTHWNDDLRKGAFQFVQISDSSDNHPKPNEIVFCGASSNQPAYMSWCYPEPRALTKIEVSPVPFQCGEESEKQAISCYLQYWNSSLQEYVNSLEFVLSETEHCSLKLPDLNSDPPAVSNKWRVLLDSSSYIDEEGDLEKDNPYLSPLALAACMSIDSCFDPNLVPSLQVRSSFELIKIIFYCSFIKTGCSPKLYPFEYDDESPRIHEFSILSLINPSFSYVKRSAKMNTELSSGLKCEILEHRNLTMLPFLSPVDIYANATLSFGKRVPVFDLEFVLNPCFVRLSQSIVHTLTYTLHSVSQELKEHPMQCIEYMLPNQYIICNNLEERIRFGQACTEENIILSPLKMHAYSWWCHKSKQLLWLSVGSLRWKWSKEFCIDEEGVSTISIDKNIAVIIKVKKLSNLQKQVIVDGQLFIHSQLNFPIQMRCEFPVNIPSKPQSCSNLFIKCIAPEQSSPSFLLSEEQLKNMHLCITGILDSQFWSENISFGDNKVLLIPWKTNDRYQSVWCQVMKRRITESIFSVIVFLSPLFIIRNNLPVSLKMNLSYHNQSVIESLEMRGKGNEIPLPNSATSDIVPNLQSPPELNITIPQICTSLTDTDHVNSVDLQDINQLYENHLKKGSLEHIWPYSFLDKSIVDSSYPCSESNKDIALAEQLPGKQAQARVEQSFRWSGLNTVVYDIKPHVMLVNRLRQDLYLFQESEMQWKLPPNSVAIPSNPFENFCIGILENGIYFKSSLITVQKSVKEKLSNGDNPDPAHFSLESSQTIPCDDSVNIVIRMQLDIFKVFLFKLTSEVNQDIVVITAFPLVILSNKINQELQFSLFCSPITNENVVIPFEQTSFTQNNSYECNPLLFWLAEKTHFSSNDLNLGFYISLSSPDCQKWSYPVYLDPKLCDSKRHTISVPINSNSKTVTTLPVVITSHLSKGLLFLVLNIDPCPLLMLFNRTTMNIFYGQSHLGPEGKCVYEEQIKYSEIPSLSPDSSAHYSFPLLQNYFPHIPDKNPMLCLGLKEDSVFIWSSPFKINADKQFVHILGICDFMVNSERIGNTIKLFIDPVNRIEVNANEVRSRIALATDTNQTFKTEKSQSKSSVRKYSEMKIRKKSISKSLRNHDSNLVSKSLTAHFLNFRMIHVSFIICDELQKENTLVEVLRLNLTNVILSSRPQKENCFTQLQDVSLCFEHVQMDNQIEEKASVWCDFPVVFHRSLNPKTTQQKEDCDSFLPNKIRENSMLVLNLVIELPSEQYDAFVIQSFHMDVLPASLHLEDTFYYQLLNLFKSYIPINFHKHESPWSDLYLPDEVKYNSLILMHPLHFQSCIINVKEISLSIHASLKLYLSLEQSLLRFQPFVKEELFTSPYELGRMLVVHYLTGALFRAGWVVGSLDLLGNPAGFARAVGAGMTDFVYLPYQGLFLGPKAFVRGLTSGAMSLFTQVSSGAINCMASLASSISKNMDFLCLDDEHLARQELIRRHLPQGVSDGLLQGLSVFGLSMLGAVAGIVDHPLQVLMSPTTPMKTASGVVGGLGKGLIGVLTKPIGGAAELLSQAGYGFLHGAGWRSLPIRQYQPIAMSLEMCSSSMIKYVCKVALCQSLGDVLLSVEATYINENSEYENNILLLTSEALCILTADEVTPQHTFALTEIKCKNAENDKSTLIIIPSRVPHKQVHLESNDVLDRVSEYLKINRAANNTNVEGSPLMTEPLFKSTPSNHVFFLYPQDRSLFLTLFNYAKSKSLRKGF